MNDYEKIEKVIRFLDQNFRNQPSLEELARIAGLSESHFHRLFSRWAGTTPKAFLKALTAAHARELLRQSRDLLDVSLESGVSGPGRLHDLLVTTEAMSPGEVKSGGLGIEIRYGIHACPFGPALIGVTGRGVCHLSFDGSAEELQARYPKAKLIRDFSKTEPIAQALLRGKGKLNLHLSGSAFQFKVWEALIRIPPGHVLSYSDVSRQIGAPSAARAVGNAVGQNSVALLIPCHRVIRETGVIGEYRWGPERKRAILARESLTRP